MASHDAPTVGKGEDNKSFIDHFEETLIAILLGIMVLITFANVIARYAFNSNILWAVEVSVFLFAWMVLLGASYGVKKKFHIGVDILVNYVPVRVRKMLTLVALAACLVFCVLMVKGAFDYWLPFVGKRSFFETDDVPMPEFLQFLSVWMNEGEAYEKLPRFIPYAVLPLSMVLLTLRFLEAGWRVIKNQQDLLIASHEAEEILEEVVSSRKAEG